MLPAPAPRCRGWPRTFRLLLRQLRYRWRGPGARQAELGALFRITNTWLRATGIEHWLAYGTLLGWHREGRLLPHDVDVDFGAPVAAYEVLRRAGHTLPRGCTLHDSSHRHHGPKLYVSRHGWEADIYFYTSEGDLLRSLERTANPGDAAPFPRDWIYPLRTDTLLDTAVAVPAQAERLLVHHYRYLGPDAVRDPVTRYFRPRQPGRAETKTPRSTP
jgi:hypothetical protein